MNLQRTHLISKCSTFFPFAKSLWQCLQRMSLNLGCCIEYHFTLFFDKIRLPSWVGGVWLSASVVCVADIISVTAPIMSPPFISYFYILSFCCEKLLTLFCLNFIDSIQHFFKYSFSMFCFLFAFLIIFTRQITSYKKQFIISWFQRPCSMADK